MTCRTAIYLIVFALLALQAWSACHNKCNKRGTCNIYGFCECFDSWEGTDCSFRKCPKGVSITDPAHTTNISDSKVTCSARGVCDRSTGLCKCDPGYTGFDCGQVTCFNGCSGNGKCVSLRTAASTNDGYRFNRTTTYTAWDADTFFGCACDFGWSGADCSQRVCDSGVDPRLANSSAETATLVCKCEPTCSGKFKLQFYGVPSGPFLKPSSRSFEVANALLAAPGVGGNTSAYVFASVIAANGTEVDDTICANGATTRTTIKFRRTLRDSPSLSFYANLISGGSLFFETTQIIRCDCLDHMCNGTFRVSFDGEMSDRLFTYTTGSQVVSALSGMRTIQAAGVTVTELNDASSALPMCVPGSAVNHTYVFTAATGNVPRIGLWSSVVNMKANSETIYDTTNTSGVLRLITFNSNDDAVKVCNGIGECDFSTGDCMCPYGWEADANLGPCGKLTVNSSSWPGLGRCPGVVTGYGTGSAAGATDDMSGVRNYQRLYIAFDPAYTAPVSEPGNITYSRIEYYNFAEENPEIGDRKGSLFLNMTSNSSAGALVIDRGTDHLFFVDTNPLASFIGRAPMNQYSANISKQAIDYLWLSVSYEIFALATDAHYNRRRLFWTVPGVMGEADGQIYWAYMDDTSPPTVYTLTSTIPQSYLINPTGFAVHYREERLYWLDKNLTSGVPVLRSTDIHGYGTVDHIAYDMVENRTVSTNITSDLLIDFYHNNTAYFVDSEFPGVIIATNLDMPLNGTSIFLSNFSSLEDRKTTRIALDTFTENITTSVRHLAMEDKDAVIFYADTAKRAIKYFRYYSRSDYKYASDDNGLAFSYPQVVGKGDTPFEPVAMTVDNGLGRPEFDTYWDCYGNGVCQGVAGNFECRCHDGFFGDCQARYCPKGPAWFHEPVVDEIAHDVYMECSNMGQCDRELGICKCRAGFEGNACERMSCSGQTNEFYQCNGRGRCLSLRDIAKLNRDELLELSPEVYGTASVNTEQWDADMIHACTPDNYGFFRGSSNISSPSQDPLRDFECPYGYNTRLTDPVIFNATTMNTTALRSDYLTEIQVINCTATAGNLRIIFRGATSENIKWNSTAYEFKLKLEATPTIGLVNVRLSNTSETDTLCSPGSSSMEVVFLSALGSIPVITVDTSSLVNGDYEGLSRTGRVRLSNSRGLQECSGHGDCDRSTGHCVCLPGWVSSDGFGELGPRGDCGASSVC